VGSLKFHVLSHELNFRNLFIQHKTIIITTRHYLLTFLTHPLMPFVLSFSTAHLSFSFAFFVHGDSTVCASMDIREHPPVRHLTEEDLNNVIKTSEQNVDNCSLDGVEQKDEMDMSNKGNMQSVILAPFGLSAVLTGAKSENIEQHAEKIINDWNTFYSMKQPDTDTLSSKLPLLVEVISGKIISEKHQSSSRQ
jgi:hypothetical protein